MKAKQTGNRNVSCFPNCSLPLVLKTQARAVSSVYPARFKGLFSCPTALGVLLSKKLNSESKFLASIGKTGRISLSGEC